MAHVHHLNAKLGAFAGRGKLRASLELDTHHGQKPFTGKADIGGVEQHEQADDRLIHQHGLGIHADYTDESHPHQRLQDQLAQVAAQAGGDIECLVAVLDLVDGPKCVIRVSGVMSGI